MVSMFYLEEFHPEEVSVGFETQGSRQNLSGTIDFLTHRELDEFTAEITVALLQTIGPV